jgi:hypothetical protein
MRIHPLCAFVVAACGGGDLSSSSQAADGGYQDAAGAASFADSDVRRPVTIAAGGSAGGAQGGSSGAPATGGGSGAGGSGGSSAPEGGSASGGAPAAGGSSGAVGTGGSSPVNTCTQVFDGQCGADEHWSCEDYKTGPVRPGYRCNTWAGSTSGMWCCIPWDGSSVVVGCNLNADCPACASWPDARPTCCKYDNETAEPITPTCGCGPGISCLPNVEAQ